MMFDEYLREHARREHTTFRPFTDDDYLRYVDGRTPRHSDQAAARESVVAPDP